MGRTTTVGGSTVLLFFLVEVVGRVGGALCPTSTLVKLL